MFTPDDFPGADRIPWQLLIRARTEYDVTLVAASVIARAVAGHASVDVARKVASVVREVGPKQEDSRALDPKQHIANLLAFADFDDICPPPWHPQGPHHVFDEFGDALAYVVIPAAITLTAAIGGESLGRLQEVLTEVGQQ
jgi:hypothetical protein